VAGYYERDNETFGLLKRNGISLLAERLLASQEGLCSMELFVCLIGWFIGWLVG
jgi:hypothetical protein